MKNFKIILPILLLILYLLCIISTNLNRDLKNTDEGIYINVASESIENNTWFKTTYFYMPYYNKLPFSIWSYKIALMMFDYKDVGYRGVQFFIGVLTLLGIFLISKKLTKNATISFLSVLLILTLPRFSKFLIEIKMDMLLLFFQVLSLLFLYCWYEKYKESGESKNFLLSFLFSLALSFSFLTKTVMFVLVPIIFFLFLIFTRELKFIVYQKKEIIFSIFIFFSILFVFFFFLIPRENIEIIYKTLFLTEIKTRALEGMHNTEEKFFYIKNVLNGQSVFPLFLLCSSFFYMLYLAVKQKRNEIIFLILWGIAPILVMSLAKSRLLWYIILSFPAFSIMVSIFVYNIFSRLFSTTTQKRAKFWYLFLCVITSVSLYNQFARATNLFYVNVNNDSLKKFVYEIRKGGKDNKKVCVYNGSEKILSKKKQEFEKFYLTQIKDKVTFLDEGNVEKEVQERSCDYYILPANEVFNKVKDSVSSIDLLTKSRITKQARVIFSFDKNDDVLPSLEEDRKSPEEIFDVFVENKKITLPYYIKDKEVVDIIGKNKENSSCILFVNLRNNKIKPKSYISLNGNKLKVIFPQNKLFFLQNIKNDKKLSISTYFNDKNKMLVDFKCGKNINKKEYLNRFLDTQKHIKTFLSTRKINLKTLHFRMLGAIII